MSLITIRKNNSYCLRLIVTLSFLLSLVSVSTSQGNPEFESTSWTLVESSEQVKVYARGLENQPNSREIKAIIQVPQSPESLLALMVDYPNATSWRRRTKGLEKVKTIDKDNWFINYITDLPWPLPDRVALLKCKVSRDPENSSITYAFKSVASEGGVQPEETLEGEYYFLPLENGLTEVTYRVTLSSPVTVPDFLADALIGDSFVTQMELLRDAVKSPRYAVNQ